MSRRRQSGWPAHWLIRTATRRIARRERHNVTRQISLATGEDLVEAPQDRCGSAAFGDRIETLNVFVPVAGLPLQARDSGTARGGHHCEVTRAFNRVYDEAVRQALTVLWETADLVCGKRLNALIPMLIDAMGAVRSPRSGSDHQDQGFAGLVRRRSTACRIQRVCISTGNASAARVRAQQSDAVSRCEPSPTGVICRRASSRST